MKHSAVVRKKRLAEQYDNHSTVNNSPITQTVIHTLEESINSNRLCHIQMKLAKKWERRDSRQEIWANAHETRESL